MKVKGTSIKTTRDFVKSNFPNRYNEFIKSLPEESKKLYTGMVNVGEWYDLKIAYTNPLDKIVELFYNKNAEMGGKEMGMYSAEIGLKGVYKVFLLVATRTMETFYQPSEIEVFKSNNTTVVNIKQFDGITEALEYRIAGWISKALELCKCKNIKCKITSQISQGNPNAKIEYKWDS